MHGIAPVEPTLYLSFAVGIASFAAADVKLGLLRCFTTRERVVSVLVLFWTMLGIAAALDIVAQHRSSGVENVVIALGFIATGGYGLWGALKAIFETPPAPPDVGKRMKVDVGVLIDPVQNSVAIYELSSPREERPRQLERPRDGRPLGAVALAFVVALLALLVAANSNVFSDVLRPRPVASAPPAPRVSTYTQSPVSYTARCGVNPAANTNEPQWVIGAFNRLWTGPGSYGAEAAGCPTAVHVVRGASKDVWWEAGRSLGGMLMSLAIDSSQHEPGLLLGEEAANIGETLLERGELLGISRRFDVATGDGYLLETIAGTALLVRHELTAPYVFMPPALVGVWNAAMRAAGAWLWPVEQRSQTASFWKFVTTEGKNVDITASCSSSESGCELDVAGAAYRYSSHIDVPLDEAMLLRYANDAPAES